MKQASIKIVTGHGTHPGTAVMSSLLYTGNLSFPLRNGFFDVLNVLGSHKCC